MQVRIALVRFVVIGSIVLLSTRSDAQTVPAIKASVKDSPQGTSGASAEDNRALPASELGEFVRSLAQRIASFPGAGHAAIKERVNAIGLAPAEDFSLDAEVFGMGLRVPESQIRIEQAMRNGFQTAMVRWP